MNQRPLIHRKIVLVHRKFTPVKPEKMRTGVIAGIALPMFPFALARLATIQLEEMAASQTPASVGGIVEEARSQKGAHP